MEVFDKEGLTNADDRKRMKKQQYEIRYQVENHHKVMKNDLHTLAKRFRKRAKT